MTLLIALAVAATGSASVRVVDPADGAILTGGSTAVIKWTGSIGDRDIEEWEAFLSVDGGRYYSVRITPHLDVSVHEFRWTVPNVASGDVRLLLRFGNEMDEHVTELPLALTIEPAFRRDPDREARPSLGESARPGDPGVTQWAEGDRSGAHVTLVAASIPEVSAVMRCEIDERSSIESVVLGLHHHDSQSALASRRQPRQRHPSACLSADILLHCCRLNI